MYHTFTGSGRRPRQVNLSGRNTTNPFAKANGSVGDSSSGGGGLVGNAAGAGGGAQLAVASAQQGRINRQIQRERLQASSRIQKVWRGHRARRRTFILWRQIWDEAEETARGAYQTSDQSLCQLRRLLLFFTPRHEPSDVARLAWYGTRQVTTAETVPCTGETWSRAYLKIQRACLAALQTASQAGDNDRRTLLGVLAFAAARQTSVTSEDSAEYYATLATVKDSPKEALQSALLAPLKQPEAYAGVIVLLTHALDSELLGLLRSAIDTRLLSEAALRTLKPTFSSRQRVWLLGNLIYLVSSNRDMSFIAAVGRLLGSLADDVDFESQPLALDNIAFDTEVLQQVQSGFPLNAYLHREISSLLDQHSIRNLLAGKHATSADGNRDAQALAGYALTLLRCFPRRSDELRMWLHLGPTGSDTTSPTRYLWDAAKETQIFADIWSSSRGIVQLLKSKHCSPREKDDWTVILVFLEMFSFDLKILDDEEFMGKSPVIKRNSAVPVEDVAVLVTFLKNLGFTLYYDAKDLNDDNSQRIPRSELSLFSNRQTGVDSSNGSLHDSKPLLVAGLSGLTIDYLKGVVTGLLRAIYERDSRRLFLPRDHWLMTGRFNMEHFIDSVVEEEERRHQVQEQDAEDRDDESDDEFDERHDGASTRSSSYLHVLRAQEARARAQRKASRRRYLESVAPRLEILQNMPFFIPFHTRVKIFREFVHMDQLKRRDGVVDQDLWRHRMMFQPQRGPHALERHHAKIKRTQEFMDAYQQFYDLGADIKEPIQITFMDQWDMPEAGIDGGGVTKEFLTSVISQAFDQESDHVSDKYFIENDQHLLYPNPSSFEDLKLRWQDIGFGENTPEIREAQRELYKQYEFLGRIIGKCLYEAILVDVSFAGFFLKQWALTGGSGSAPSESHYRPNINDLRELDEGLYRGLLQVKNADDAEDLGLSFSVNDAVGPANQQHIMEVDLVPKGRDIAVTNENRLQYINAVAAYRLKGQAARQSRAFLRGISDIIQPSWLSMFNQAEMQTLIGGSGAGIDIDDLRRNTLYGGTYVIGDDGQEHASVKSFWNVMQRLPDADVRKVLKFVTSTPRGPLLGFGYLNPRFSIRDSGSDENRYPTTSTCVNLLKLPMYKSEGILREKLLAAVNSGAGFDLS